MPASSQIGLICQHLLDDSLSLLKQTPDALEDDAIVHQLRVTTKRLRAAWKMVSKSVDKTLKSRCTDSLRELSAMLSSHRDQFVLISLSRELSENHPDASFDEVIDLIEKENGQNVATATVERVIAILEEENAAWESVSFQSPELEQKSHRRAIKKCSRKARRATQLALEDPHPEFWHDWRKRVKRLRYQREFLAEIQGRKPGKWDARISLLGSRLGDRNDLANLTGIVEKMGNPPLLRKAIAAREREILGNCRRLGRRHLG